ncbi:hypothetical protein BKA64DRAFT_71611 [Cadophora sp. MPI-SDFR-AT-0126]|nr:hypothetical protein BKA64DRAFT_71611 [Leotiomycetes sp. MPI-SDFR-AT-0126]
MESLLDLPNTVRTDIDNQFQQLARSEHLEHSKTRAVFMDHTKTQLDSRVCHSIIESLHFPTRTVRHETIPEAHKRTFEWIFRDPVIDGKPWSNFVDWLKSGDGIYWINGKAGSGKSTLMKFIVDHDQTSELLGVWAQGTSLETPSFFFWKHGHEDQRSQEGLLRSLLYDVLRKCPALVPSVFPDVWERNFKLTSQNVSPVLSTWTLTKLKHAFARLVTCKTIRISFFLDGLDEYEGDHVELAEYFGQLACSDHVKLCVSSRPWPPFQDAFQNCRGLKLQDLTSGDIKQYVEDKINENANMALLKRRMPVRSNFFVDNLIWKAEGVFLWVTLVVKSLLKGLSHRNDLETLEKRLDSMPPDLENLYSHMLSSIDSHDMEKGSKLFQLFEACDSDKDLQLIYVALNGATAEALSSPLAMSEHKSEELQQAQFDSMFEEMNIILQACCGGMIEVTILDDEIYKSWRQGRLSYIHRTVSDFLSKPEIWNEILRHTSNASWFPQKSLLSSSVICLENFILPGLEARKESVYYVEYQWACFCDHASDFAIRGVVSDDDCTNLTEDFDRAATNVAHSCFWNQSDAKTKFNHWSNYITQPTLPRQDFLSLTADCGLWFYVKHRLKEDPSLVAHRLEVPLLAHSLLRFESSILYTELFFMTASVILSFSADPNEVFRGHSCWQYWVTILHTKGQVLGPRYDHNFKAITVEMLRAGADLTLGCLKGRTALRDLYRELWTEDGFRDRYVFIFIQMHHLVDHSEEAWRDSNQNDKFCRHERVLFAERENLPFGERHCLKAVIEDAFRERDPEGADEILQLIEELEAKEASEECEVPIRERKRKRLEEDVE